MTSQSASPKPVIGNGRKFPDLRCLRQGQPREARFTEHTQHCTMSMFRQSQLLVRYVTLVIVARQQYRVWSSSCVCQNSVNDVTCVQYAVYGSPIGRFVVSFFQECDQFLSQALQVCRGGVDEFLPQAVASFDAQSSPSESAV